MSVVRRRWAAAIVAERKGLREGGWPWAEFMAKHGGDTSLRDRLRRQAKRLPAAADPNQRGLFED